MRKPPTIKYPDGHVLRTVHASGRVRWGNNRLIHIGGAFAGELVGFTKTEDQLWEVYFGDLLLGLIDEQRIGIGLVRM